MKIWLLFLLILVNYLTFSQDQQIADSLVKEFNNCMTDYQKQKELLNNIAYYQTNPDSALLYAEILINKATVNNDNLYLHKGYYQKGNALRIKGHLDKAIQANFESLKYAEKINYLKGIGLVYSSLGDVYSISQDYNNSILYYNKAISLLKTESDSISFASVLLNAGNIYSKIPNYDSALIYYAQAGQIFEKKRYKTGMAYCCGSSGRIYAYQNNETIAVEKLTKAIDI